jgi:uncharacterized protein with HEPN domain
MYLEDPLLTMTMISEYIEALHIMILRKTLKQRNAVIRNFEIIGEAAGNIPPEVKEKYHEVQWDEIYLLRNKVSHEYFGNQFLSHDSQLPGSVLPESPGTKRFLITFLSEF